MNTRSLILGLVFVLSVAASNMHLSGAEDALPQKLSDLDRWRNGKNTPFEEVEQRGRELLAEYIQPEQQAQIYFHLTEIHGQSGMVHADLVIQYSQSALALPVDPLQRLQLYVYWGGAIQSADSNKPVQKRKPFSEVRRAAVMPYLEGLKEMQKYKIPDQLAKLPRVDAYDVPETAPNYQQIKKRHDDQAAAWAEAQFDRKLWFNLQTLTNAVVDLYSRKPHAATELRQLAAKILDNPEQVDALMKRIEANGALKDDPLPEKTNAK